MKTFLLVLLMSLTMGNHLLIAQSYFYNLVYPEKKWIIEMDVGGGAMNCLTDIGGRKGIGKGFLKDLYLPVSNPDWSVHFAAIYKQWLVLRSKFTSGNITSGDHALAAKDPDRFGRYGRNLSFESMIREWQFGLEWYPFDMKVPEADLKTITPYFMFGFANYTFNPTTSWQGRSYALWPLRLEGQGFVEYSQKAYSLRQWNIPLAVGWKYRVSPVVAVKLELCYRKLFTDYLDDVSTYYVDPLLFTKYLPPDDALLAMHLYNRMKELTPGVIVKEGELRGNVRNNDSYLTMQLHLSVAFRKRE